jgi:iron complex outermembrane receptor protein
VAGGGRTDLTEVTSNRFLIGAKGTVANWDYEAAFTTSTNKGDISFGPGQFSYAKLTPLVTSGAINVFGSQDATSLAALNSALLSGLEQSAKSKANEFDFHASTELMKLPAGPLGFAAGFSFRKETLDQISYPVLASGDQVGGAGPIPSVTGDRKVTGLFTEFAIPIIKDLDLSIAARYDSYKNGFGTSFSNTSPKASLSFRATKDVLVRGSVGQGYRAPTLFENLRPFTSGNNTNANWNDPIRCPGGVPINNSVDTSTECNVQLSSAVSGDLNLKPEKSDQYSLGIVFSPIADASVSLDYWSLTVKDAVVQVSEKAVLENPTAYKDNFYRYDPAQFPDGWTDDGRQTGAIKGSTNAAFPLAYVYLPYNNTAKFYASGLDLNAQYKLKLSSLGSMTFNLDGTYYATHGYQYFATPKESDAGAYKDFGPTPRWRHAATVGYSYSNWAASLTNNFTRGYADYDPVRRVADYSTWDARLGWKPLKGLELVAGVKNLFDADPPQSNTSANFQTGYDAQFANPLGRTYYLRAGYKFF